MLLKTPNFSKNSCKIKAHSLLKITTHKKMRKIVHQDQSTIKNMKKNSLLPKDKKLRYIIKNGMQNKFNRIIDSEKTTYQIQIITLTI